MVGAEHAQRGERVSVFWQPGGAGLFESGLADMTVSAFDHARADRQAQGQGTWIVQGIESIAQVAMALADRGCFLRRGLRFQMFGQSRDDPGRRAPLQSRLLGGPPHRSSRGQIFTDVKEVAQEVALRPEHFLALQRQQPEVNAALMTRSALDKTVFDSSPMFSRVGDVFSLPNVFLIPLGLVLTQ